MTRESTLRVGDAERDATVELLNRHYADGRLTALEREERTAVALTARTADDLSALLADLPDIEEPRSGPRRARPRLTRPTPGLLRAVLVAAVVVFVALHLVPVFAVVVAFFVLSRIAFGWHGPWSYSRRPSRHW